MGTTRHLFFIINRHAGTAAQATPETIQAEFQRHLRGFKQVEAEFFFPENPEQLRTTLEARLQAGDIDRLVACGGDGTITEMLDILARHADVPLAVVPMGTGNLLALNLGIPTTLKEAIRVAAAGETRPIDLARIDDRLFILNASVGLDAEIMAGTDHATKKRWGTLAYFIRGVPMLPGTRPARFRIEADGHVIRTKAIGITVSNAGSRMPGGIEICPDVQPDDGLLHATIFRPRTVPDYLLTVFQLLLSLFGRRRKNIQIVKARRITIETKPVLKTQADGNVIGETPVTLEIVEPGLLICVPKSTFDKTPY